MSRTSKAFTQVLMRKRYRPLFIVILFVLETFLFSSPQFWDPNSPIAAAIALGVLYSIIDRTKIASFIMGFLSVIAALVGGGPLWALLHGEPVGAPPLWMLSGFLFWGVISAFTSILGATFANFLLRKPTVRF